MKKQVPLAQDFTVEEPCRVVASLAPVMRDHLRGSLTFRGHSVEICSSQIPLSMLPEDCRLLLPHVLWEFPHGFNFKM